MKNIAGEKRWHKEASILSTYSLVSLVTTLLYLLLYIWLVEIVHYTPLGAAVIAYLPCLILGFLLCYRFVFDSSASYAVSGGRYLLVNGGGYIVNTLGIYVTIELLDLDYMIGQLLTFLVVASNNFILNRVWTFSR